MEVKYEKLQEQEQLQLLARKSYIHLYIFLYCEWSSSIPQSTNVLCDIHKSICIYIYIYIYIYNKSARMKERCRDGCRTSLLIAGVVLVPAIFHTLLPPCHPYITIHFMEMIIFHLYIIDIYQKNHAHCTTRLGSFRSPIVYNYIKLYIYYGNEV